MGVNATLGGVGKPLKRLTISRLSRTQLKLGVNESEQAPLFYLREFSAEQNNSE